MTRRSGHSFKRSRLRNKAQVKRLRGSKSRKKSTFRKLQSSAKNRTLLERKLQEGARQVRLGKSAAAAARSVDLPPKYLTRYLTKNRIARRVGKHWLFYKRGRRQMRTFSEGRIRYPILSPAEASYNGRFMSAVGQLLKTNDEDHLKPFVGKSITDIEGQEYRFEIRSNVLYRLNAGTEPFETYRIMP